MFIVEEVSAKHKLGSETMNTFRTAVVRVPAGPDSIEIIDVPVVEPGPGEIRVEVAAAGVNPVDLAVAGGVFHDMGLVHQPSHTGLGWDFAGTVAAAGPGVGLAPGTRVAGLVTGFDRDFGTYAEQLVVPASDVAVVPDGLDLAAASTVPVNGLAAAQIVDLLGDPPAGGRLLVTGAAGAVGGYVLALARDRGWRVTGLARPEDEKFVHVHAAELLTHTTPAPPAPPATGGEATAQQNPAPPAPPTTDAEVTAQGNPAPSATAVEPVVRGGREWDGVVDAAALQEGGLALVRDGGIFVGVVPGAEPAAERGITVRVVVTEPDGDRLAGLLARTASGELPARVHAVLPLDRAADAHRAMAKGGIRGRYVLQP